MGVMQHSRGLLWWHEDCRYESQRVVGLCVSIEAPMLGLGTNGRRDIAREKKGGCV